MDDIIRLVLYDFFGRWERVSAGSLQFISAGVLIVRLVDYFVGLVEEESHLLASTLWVPVFLSCHRRVPLPVILSITEP